MRGDGLRWWGRGLGRGTASCWRLKRGARMFPVTATGCPLGQAVPIGAQEGHAALPQPALPILLELGVMPQECPTWGWVTASRGNPPSARGAIRQSKAFLLEARVVNSELQNLESKTEGETPSASQGCADTKRRLERRRGCARQPGLTAASCHCPLPKVRSVPGVFIPQVMLRAAPDSLRGRCSFRGAHLPFGIRRPHGIFGFGFWERAAPACWGAALLGQGYLSAGAGRAHRG